MAILNIVAPVSKCVCSSDSNFPVCDPKHMKNDAGDSAVGGKKPLKNAFLR